VVCGECRPERPHKLAEAIIRRVRELDKQGLSLAAIGTAVGIGTSTVRVALGRVTAPTGGQATRIPTGDDSNPVEAANRDGDRDEVVGADAGGAGSDQPGAALAVLPMPAARTLERCLVVAL
jgi:hypothetical protein